MKAPLWSEKKTFLVNVVKDSTKEDVPSNFFTSTSPSRLVLGLATEAYDFAAGVALRLLDNLFSNANPKLKI